MIAAYSSSPSKATAQPVTAVRALPRRRVREVLEEVGLEGAARRRVGG
ncbi:hypothetical protein ACFV4Q_00415 [Streptomyces nojiriensis]